MVVPRRLATARQGWLTLWALALGAIALGQAPVRGGAATELRDVRGVDDLKRWFNKERGHPRVILFLSPT